MDKIHLMYLRSILGIKDSSSNIITLGECGSIPPSVTIQAICITYLKRIQSFPDTSLLKQTLNEMKKLYNLGFNTWYSRVCELAKQNNIDVECKYTKREIKLAMEETFKMQWHSNLNNVTHRNFKFDFRMEPQLNLVTNYKYRNAITKLRASSHTLEVERVDIPTPKPP